MKQYTQQYTKQHTQQYVKHPAQHRPARPEGLALRKGTTAMPELTSRRGLLFGTAAVSAGVLLAGCTSNESDDEPASNDQPAADDKKGKQVTIGFAGPQADHGWLNAINDNAKSRAKKYEDVTLEITEGSNDTAAQIGQIETLINKKVDVLVILPADGKALTQVGLKAMRAGIPVVNLDRIFNSPQAYRCYIGGDNFGMGLNAGHYIGEQLKDKKNAKVIELAGLDNLELTKQRTAGFDAALKNYPNIKKVARQAAEFTVESGQAKMSQLLQAQSSFDALWNHDDDQGVGALRAIEQAGRDDFIMVGGAGALSAMQAIESDNSVLKATVLYPPTMAASAIDLARALGQGKGVSGLAEFEIPSSLTLYSAVVDKENVKTYLPTGFK
ncbi:sugar ABC transporter substrate-binding protein [Streptomyces tauricus]|nr:sugar ABC transporter substrate-binding protein [Streptomyces tauricus]